MKLYDILSHIEPVPSVQMHTVPSTVPLGDIDDDAINPDISLDLA